MKRIISLVLTMVLIVACMAVPVMADELDNSPYFNLLDYGTSNFGSNTAIVKSGQKISYDLPSFYYIRKLDILFTSTGVLDRLQVSFNDNYVLDVPFQRIGDDLYRAEISTYYGVSSIGIIPFFFSSSQQHINILNIEVGVSEFSSYAVPFYGYVYDYSYSPIKQTNFSGDGSSPMSSVSISPNAAKEDFEGFVSRIYLSSWNAYDFISLDIALWSSSFSSIMVEMDGLPIPYELNTVESTDVLGTTLYLLDVLIDTRNVDRTSDSYILVDVSGSVNPTFTGSFTVRSSLGYVSVPSPSLWTHWFSNLQGWLSSGFSSVVSGLSSFSSNISSYISNQTSNLSNALSSLGSSIGGYISNQTDLINSNLVVIYSGLTNFHTDVSVFFSNQTTVLTNSIRSWGQSIINSINSGVDRIVSALSPSGSANDFNDKVQQQGSELESMAGAMNAVTRPNVSTAIPDIGGYLTVSGPVTLAAVFDPFWKNSYILRLLLGSLAVSVAFTVVYGGKK